jgi:hypothetical protein
VTDVDEDEELNWSVGPDVSVGEVVSVTILATDRGLLFWYTL